MKEIIAADIPRIMNLLEKTLSVSDYQSITRLGGLTNHTYCVELKNSQCYVVRLPGEGTETLINRAHEQISTQLACNLEIDAQVLYFGTLGEKVTCYIDGAETLCAESFKNEEILKKAAEVLHTLHTCGADTNIPFDVLIWHQTMKR